MSETSDSENDDYYDNYIQLVPLDPKLVRQPVLPEQLLIDKHERQKKDKPRSPRNDSDGPNRRQPEPDSNIGPNPDEFGPATSLSDTGNRLNLSSEPTGATDSVKNMENKPKTKKKPAESVKSLDLDLEETLLTPDLSVEDVYKMLKADPFTDKPLDSGSNGKQSVNKSIVEEVWKEVTVLDKYKNRISDRKARKTSKAPQTPSERIAREIDKIGYQQKGRYRKSLVKDLMSSGYNWAAIKY